MESHARKSRGERGFISPAIASSGLAGADHLEGEADRVGSGGAGGGDVEQGR